MRKYKLEPQLLMELESYGSCLGWYSKGHHPAKDFLDECLSEFSKPPEGWEADITPEKVRHTYWRNVPFSDYQFMICEAEAGKPGAYPVTVIDF